MIDFNSLPLEIKRMIAKQLRRSDESFRTRVGKPNASTREQLKGRGLATLSLVNKEMRKICLKGLFGKIKSTRVRDEIFEYRVLDLHGGLITSFEFEGKMSLETISFIVLYVLPRLSNLRRIIINDQRFFTSFIESPGTPPDWNRSTFVWSKFVEIANQIDKWQFDFANLAEERMEALLNANVDRIQTLILHPTASHPFLSAENDSIPSLLDHCPSLHHLQLRIFHSLEATAATPADPIISKTALSYDYAFRKNLTILDICYVSKRPNFPSSLDFSVLHFASLFAELLDFHICGKYEDSETQDTQIFSFPRLLRLTVGRWTFTATTSFLQRMDMPRIRYLECHFEDSIELARGAHRNLPDTLALAEQIKTCGNTLHSLRLQAKYGLYSSSLASFLDVLSPYSFEVLTTWDQGEAGSFIDIVDSSDGPTREMAREGLVAGSKELIGWAKERIEETKETKDLSGARQMFKALKNVKDLRKWLKE